MSTPFYDLASLVVVPSGYKASKVYAQKPLTTDGQLTFSRASTATRVNSAGLIETVSSNVPRLDYLGSTCPKLQLEPQRTNIITRSSEFDNVDWTKTSITVTANATTSPDGTSNADLFTTSDLSGTVYRAYHNSTGGSDVTNTISGFFKYGNHPYAYITADSSGFGKFAIFNVQTGVITFTSTGYTSTITDYGNGWYRCTLTGTIDSNNNIQFGLSVSATSYAGTSLANGKTLYVWGAQREHNSAYATSYVPTTTAAVTRLADACSKTGISSLIGQTEGTIYWETQVDTPTATGHETFLNVDNGSFSDTIYMFKTASAQFIAEVYDNGVLQATFSKSGVAAGIHKLAIAYANNNTAFFVDGVQVGSTDTSCSVPTTSRIQLGQNVFGPSTDKTAQVLLFKTRLTNAQLAELTSL